MPPETRWPSSKALMLDDVAGSRMFSTGSPDSLRSDPLSRELQIPPRADMSERTSDLYSAVIIWIKGNSEIKKYLCKLKKIFRFHPGWKSRENVGWLREQPMECLNNIGSFPSRLHPESLWSSLLSSADCREDTCPHDVGRRFGNDWKRDRWRHQRIDARLD